MRSFLKDLISDPLILLLLVAIFVVYIAVAFEYATQGKHPQKLEKIITLLIFFIIPGVQISPFNLIHPENLAAPEVGVPAILSRLIPYGCTMLILKTRYSDFLQNILLIFLDPFLTVFLALLVVSMFWSETPNLTLRASLVMLGLSAVAAHIAKRYSWKEMCHFLRLSTAFISILSLFYAIALPGIGVSGKGWKGVLRHGNPLGSLMAFTTILWGLYAVENPRLRKVSSVISGISLIVMLQTNSASAKVLLAVLLCLVVSLGYLRKLNFKIAFTAISIFLVISIIMGIFVVENVETIIVDVLDKDLTLNGRIPLWTKLIQASANKPLLGYGYKGFWQEWRGPDNPAAPYATSDFGWIAPHGHNGFLDVIIDFGWVGFFCFFISFVKTIALGVMYMIRNKNSDALIPLVMLTYIIMSNLAQSDLMIARGIWFYYIILVIRMSLDITGKEIRGYRNFN
ncbi:O-antigen ligase family protein [Laspinema olomoucense]|uniref:O-antigen ligase family protein n=1 Tax=Laspinema olomoucense TaxID=3231600 RepID=UPI0021BB08F6|nr:O-antigen ligase family protein [Laspinema sp. D3a]MCT7990851.1 O-antigen ligase family protein [Laspinema sp. D3a]